MLRLERLSRQAIPWEITAFLHRSMCVGVAPASDLPEGLRADAGWSPPGGRFEKSAKDGCSRQHHPDIRCGVELG